MENSIIYLKSRSIISYIVNIPHWKFVLSILLPFVVLFFSTPSFKIIQEHWEPILLQSQDPFLPRYYPPHSHASKLAFRFVPAIIIGWLNLSAFGIIVWQYINGVLLFYVSSLVIEKLTKSKFIAFNILLLTAFIFTGKVSFVNFKDTFDSLILVLLLSCFLTSKKTVIFLLILVSGFIDERGLICSGFVFLYYYYLSTETKSYRSHLVYVLFSWICYFLIRLLLNRYLGLTTSTGGFDFKTMALNLNNAPLSIWQALEGGWIIVLLFLNSVFKKNKWLFVMIFGQLVVTFIIAFLVFDVTRSLVYLYPLLLISIIYLSKINFSIQRLELLSFFAMIISFLYPAYCSAGSTNNWLLPLPLKLIFEYFTT